MTASTAPSVFDEGESIAANGTTLFMAEVGDRTKPPLVLLHGGLQSRRSFAPLAGHLADAFRLIAIDTRGHGRSRLSDLALSYRQLEDDVATALEVLGLSDAALVGHSDGGIVVLRLAASGAVRPRFAVTIGAHAGLAESDPTRDFYRGLTLEDWYSLFPADIARYEAENPEPDFPRLFEATRAMWLGTGDDAYPGARVRRIEVPLLVIHGDEDFLVSRRHSVELADMVGGSHLLSLPFASHTAHEEEPKQVAASIKALSTRIG